MNERRDPSRFAPEGLPTVIPRIVVGQARQLVDFIREVFGAEGDYRSDIPTFLRIGGSFVMVSEVGIRNSSPAFLYVYVADTDSTYRRALGAGAKSLEEPSEQVYGDRRAMIEDRWGNTWQIATHRGMTV